MKKIDEGLFLHAKPQTCGNEFHAPSCTSIRQNEAIRQILQTLTVTPDTVICHQVY